MLNFTALWGLGRVETVCTPSPMVMLMICVLFHLHFLFCAFGLDLNAEDAF